MCPAPRPARHFLHPLPPSLVSAAGLLTATGSLRRQDLAHHPLLHLPRSSVHPAGPGFLGRLPLAGANRVCSHCIQVPDAALQVLSYKLHPVCHVVLLRDGLTPGTRTSQHSKGHTGGPGRLEKSLQMKGTRQGFFSYPEPF